jgi:hypothetical protein
MLYTPNGIAPTNADLPKLDTLYKKSRSGLWGIFIYLAVTVIVVCNKDQSLAAVLPPHMMKQLGTVPPGLYGRCAIMDFNRKCPHYYCRQVVPRDQTYKYTKSQLAFRIGFYILFFVVGGLAQWFNELFVSGLTHSNTAALQRAQLLQQRAIDVKSCHLSSSAQESF